MKILVNIIKMASYLPPVNNVAIFDSINFNAVSEGLTFNDASKYFIRYPYAQGTCNFGDINVTGTGNFSDNIILSGVSGTNYLQFPDGTKQYSAVSVPTNMCTTDTSQNITATKTFTTAQNFNNNIIMGGTSGVNYIQFPDGTQQTTATPSLANYVTTNTTQTITGAKSFIPAVNTDFPKFINTNRSTIASFNVYKTGTTPSTNPITISLFDNGVTNQTATPFFLTPVPAGYTGAYSHVYGFNAGANLTSGNANYIFGNNSGTALTTGSFNFLLGSSLQCAAGSQRNIRIGHGLETSTANIGNNNISIGVDALFNSTTSNNVGIGDNALRASTTGDNNMSIGSNAGYATTTGRYNCFIGNYAGQNNTSGSNSTFLGYQAGKASSTNSSNTAIGYQAGGGNSVVEIGNHNIWIGKGCASNRGDGNYNIILGVDACVNCLSSNNIAMGNNNLTSATGANNVALGHQSGTAITSGANNTLVGYFSAKNVTSGSNNVVLGSNANSLVGITTGTYNVVVGADTCAGTTTGSNNIAIGKNNMMTTTVSGGNIAIGNNALQSINNGDNNIGIGNNALKVFVPSAYSAGVGYNVAVGNDALSADTTGINNTAVGVSALKNITTANNSTAVGFEAGNGATTGTQNTLLGYQAGYNIIGGQQNTYIGAQAGYNNQGSENIAIGDNTFKASGNIGNDNIFLGAYSDFTSVPTVNPATNNTVIGSRVNFGVNNGKGNIIIGASAMNTTDYVYNTLLGNNIIINNGDSSGSKYGIQNTGGQDLTIIGNTNSYMPITGSWTYPTRYINLTANLSLTTADFGKKIIITGTETASKTLTLPSGVTLAGLVTASGLINPYTGRANVFEIVNLGEITHYISLVSGEHYARGYYSTLTTNTLTNIPLARNLTLKLSITSGGTYVITEHIDRGGFCQVRKLTSVTYNANTFNQIIWNGDYGVYRNQYNTSNGTFTNTENGWLTGATLTNHPGYQNGDVKPQYIQFCFSFVVINHGNNANHNGHVDGVCRVIKNDETYEPSLQINQVSQSVYTTFGERSSLTLQGQFFLLPGDWVSCYIGNRTTTTISTIVQEGTISQPQICPTFSVVKIN